MAEFDESWRRLVASAREAREPLEGLTAQRVRELAALARSRPESHSERRSLLALAALCACVLLALVPWREQVGDFVAGATSELAALPARVPRPPRPPSGAAALAALLELPPFTTESQP